MARRIEMKSKLLFWRS